MINLLPDTEKYVIRKEYNRRFLALSLGAVFTIIVIALILLIPSYILTLYKRSVAENLLTRVPPASTIDQTDFTEKIAMAKRLAMVLRPEPVSFLPTDYITYITNHKSGDIQVVSISYNKKDKELPHVHIIGVAKTRQSLVDFTNVLKAEPHTASVDLPVSSFAEEGDIRFDIDITTK